MSVPDDYEREMAEYERKMDAYWRSETPIHIRLSRNGDAFTSTGTLPSIRSFEDSPLYVKSPPRHQQWYRPSPVAKPDPYANPFYTPFLTKEIFEARRKVNREMARAPSTTREDLARLPGCFICNDADHFDAECPYRLRCPPNVQVNDWFIVICISCGAAISNGFCSMGCYVGTQGQVVDRCFDLEYGR
ncbi:hypothetical protein OROGR_010630 [Orobanche gracilis]